MHFVELSPRAERVRTEAPIPLRRRFNRAIRAIAEQPTRGVLNPPGLDPAALAVRTLTNLYNQRPTWLAHAHATLDAAAFDAYGWPAGLPDEEILERLLDLNLARPPA